MTILKLDLPRHKVTLPISKKIVEFRPFTVKEEKLLLLAQEDGSLTAMADSIGAVMSNCTGGACTIDNLNKTDAEYLYVKIRNKSMGEGVVIKASCKSCEIKTTLTLDYDSIKASHADVKIAPVMIMDNIWVKLRLPTMKESFEMMNLDGIAAIAYALDTIIEGEEAKDAADYTIEERIEFVESMTSTQIDMFTPFFESLPKLMLDMDFTCKCGTSNHVHIEGVENFFD